MLKVFKMGCFHSKKEAADQRPNVFRVVNIDQQGVELCAGKLEITDSDIILYREGRESTVWPLHSLRRYGFEGEIFSFESGRRCDTGEGIYAFRCRRATTLFQALQTQIQLRNNNGNDNAPFPVSGLTSSPQGRQTVQAFVTHRSSIDNGPPENLATTLNNELSNIDTNTPVISQTPHSPSSADILEVMPLYPLSQANGNQVTNVYQVRDFKRENNNNQAEVGTDTQHAYTNDLNRDLAMLRSTLKQEAALNTMRDLEDETRFLETRYVNEYLPNTSNNITSPTLSNTSDQYAQLSVEQLDAGRLYVNISPNDSNVLDSNKNETVPSTPLTPKQLDYCSLSGGPKPEINVNTYANLVLGEVSDVAKNNKQFFNTSENTQKVSESDTFTSLSPVEEMEVNYAVLDIDPSKETIIVARDVASPESQSYHSSKNESSASCSSQSRGRIVSQTSVERATTSNTSIIPPSANIGYTTIDFDKTVALTSVAAGAELEASRKNRHNSCSFICGSPGNSEKNRSNN